MIAETDILLILVLMFVSYGIGAIVTWKVLKDKWRATENAA